MLEDDSARLEPFVSTRLEPFCFRLRTHPRRRGRSGWCPTAAPGEETARRRPAKPKGEKSADHSKPCFGIGQGLTWLDPSAKGLSCSHGSRGHARTLAASCDRPRKKKKERNRLHF